MVKAECPSCYFEMELEDIIEGEVITCEDCGADFEVVAIKDGVATLKPAETTQEDWGE